MSEQYYKKINLDLSGLDLSKIRGGSLQEGYLDTFRSYNLLDDEYFQNFLSQRIKFKIPPLAINYTEISNYGALPHTDPPLAIINYFINSADAVTTFWEVKNKNEDIGYTMPKLQHDGSKTKSGSVVYNDLTKLTEIGSFRTESNCAYVLNPRIIHSISKPNLDDQREFIRFLWLDLSIEELIDNIIYI
jgi:hypothetical protein